jgi:hypothetical protein
MPEPAPVTSATLSCRSIRFSLLVCAGQPPPMPWSTFPVPLQTLQRWPSTLPFP